MRFTIRIFVFVYYILYEYLLFKKNEKLGSLPRYLVEKNQRKKVLESRTENKNKVFPEGIKEVKKNSFRAKFAIYPH